MITGSGGKARSCDYDDVLARLYHLTKLVHVGTGSYYCHALAFGPAGPDHESQSSKNPKLSLFGCVMEDKQQKRPGSTKLLCLSAAVDLERRLDVNGETC